MVLSSPQNEGFYFPVINSEGRQRQYSPFPPILSQQTDEQDQVLVLIDFVPAKE